MSSYTTDPELTSGDKVRCAECLSEILLKNIKAHQKTQKHQIAVARLSGKGGFSREIPEEKTPLPSKRKVQISEPIIEEEPEEVEVEEEDDEENDTDYIVECLKQLGTTLVEKIDDLHSDLEWVMQKMGYNFDKEVAEEEEPEESEEKKVSGTEILAEGGQKLEGLAALNKALGK